MIDSNVVIEDLDKLVKCARETYTIAGFLSIVNSATILREALEKQIPRTALLDEDSSYFVCGNCKSGINYTSDKIDHRYCLNCGQRLDWGDWLKLKDTNSMYEWTQYRKKVLNSLQQTQMEYEENLYNAAIYDNEYRKELSKALLEKRAEGVQISILENVCRGLELVEKARLKRDLAEGKAKALQEKINILKIELRIIEEEIAAMRLGR